MQVKRALMVLAASLEFEKGHNSEIQERFSDNVEVGQVWTIMTNPLSLRYPH